MAHKLSSKTDGLPRELPILRFSLRRMFLFVTALGILLALMSIPVGIGKLALPLIAAVIVLHVASTIIGSRLRELADDRRQWEEEHGMVVEGDVLPDWQRTRLIAGGEKRPQPSLGVRSAIPSWSWRRILAGAVAGGSLGAILLALTIGHRTSWLGIAMGSLSTSILGAWLVFLGGNFWWIVRHTWQEALAQERQDESQRKSVGRDHGDGI